MSAIAPAGSASSITGRVSAASTSATIDGDDESEVINQPAPTSCIQVPMFETIVAIHRLRNSPLRSGLHGDCVLRYGSLRRKGTGPCVWLLYHGRADLCRRPATTVTSRCASEIIATAGA